MLKTVEGARTFLKTAPFQCQGRMGVVNERLGEEAYGRVRGSGGEAWMPVCQRRRRRKQTGRQS